MIDLGITELAPVGRPWKATKKTDALPSRIRLALSCGCCGEWVRVSRGFRWYFDPFFPRLWICRLHAARTLLQKKRRRPCPTRGS